MLPAGLDVVDARSADAYVAGHVPGSASLPWKGDDGLRDRLFQLPPPGDQARLGLVVDAADRDAVLEFLLSKRYTVPPEHVLVPDGAEPAIRALLSETGERPHARLWRPVPFVAETIDEIEQHLAGEHGPAAHSGPWTALDVGCGAGRNAVFMAMRGSWHIDCIDNYPSMLDNTRRLGEAHRVADALTIENVDVRKPEPLTGRQYDMVLVGSFLLRGLFPLLADLVRPGGVIVYVHFLQGAQFVGKCTPKKDSSLLNEGELATVFGPEAGFLVMRDERTEATDGRPVAQFLAAKKRS